MRIFSGVLAAGLLAAASVAAADPPAVSQSALQKGLNAYQAGQQDTAIPALAEAAEKGAPSGRLFAEFYLARIYAENVGAAADHAKAYMLYRKIAEENLNVDPNRSKRAPFVAKALIALAGYVRTGIKEIDLAPNPRRAADYLHHAATFFGDREAQFELARIYLGGEASGDDVKRGLHYLATLTEASHPAAQAVLADLLWRGRHVKKDDRRALALVTMAAANAPAHERIWIEESYATIFCAASDETRREADGMIERWRRAFAPPDPSGPAAGYRSPERQCANGEPVAITRGADKTDVAKLAPPASAAPLKGSAAPSTLFRAAGVIEARGKK
jgi:exopolysaccharide production negative regulator